MSEQKSIEGTLNQVLGGEALKNALDFTAFLRANAFSFEDNPDEHEEGKWSGAIGGTVGDSIGYMYINSGENYPDPWNIWLNEYDFDDDGSAEDGELKEFLWGNVNECTRCNPNWETCGGGDKMILGKEFKNLCHSPMFFYMPDAQNMEKLKRLLLKIKQKRG